MRLAAIKNTLDQLYQDKHYQQAHTFLLEEINKARIGKNNRLELALANELLGYYRVSEQFSDGNQVADNILSLIQNLSLNQEDIATSHLNIATFYSASKQLAPAASSYAIALPIFEEIHKNKPEQLASIYNNYSIFLQNCSDNQNALAYQLKAIANIQQVINAEVELATSYTNLANLYFSMGEFTEANTAFHLSKEIFEQQNIRDPHYAGCLLGLGNLHFTYDRYEQALNCYRTALDIMLHFNNPQQIKAIETDISFISQLEIDHKKSGLELCRQFYENTLMPLLKSQLPEVLSFITIGCVGPGSECFGFDDALSRDHDFTRMCCLWLDKPAYDFYQHPLENVLGSLNLSNPSGSRRGLQETGAFYLKYLKVLPDSLNSWLKADEHALASMTNGAIFYESNHQFMAIRRFLSEYYPEDIRLKKIIARLAYMAQCG